MIQLFLPIVIFEFSAMAVCCTRVSAALLHAPRAHSFQEARKKNCSEGGSAAWLKFFGERSKRAVEDALRLRKFDCDRPGLRLCGVRSQRAAEGALRLPKFDVYRPGLRLCRVRSQRVIEGALRLLRVVRLRSRRIELSEGEASTCRY